MSPSIIAVIILAVTLFFYISEVIPLAVTSLLSCIAMGIFGCCSYNTIFSGFSNDVTIMVLGMCIVGDTFFHTGAAAYFGKKLIRLFGNNEKGFMLACIILSGVISAFFSNTATVAMMLPIAEAAVVASKGVLHKKTLYMPIGFAAIAGGGITLIGSTPQVIVQGILEQNGIESVGFFEYAMTGIPKFLLLLLYFLFIGKKLLSHLPEEEIKEAKNTDAEQRFTGKMLISLIIMILCILGFITQVFNYSIIAMLGACACVVFRCVKVKDAFKTVDWNTVILLASALSMAACLNESGAGVLIVDSIVKLTGSEINKYFILVIIAVLASLMANTISTSATTTILVPICIYLANNFGMNPRSLAIAVAVFANVVYLTPTSSPPNAMTLTAGYRFVDYVKVGGILNIITLILTLCIFPLFHPL